MVSLGFLKGPQTDHAILSRESRNHLVLHDRNSNTIMDFITILSQQLLTYKYISWLKLTKQCTQSSKMTAICGRRSATLAREMVQLDNIFMNYSLISN